MKSTFLFCVLIALFYVSTADKHQSDRIRSLTVYNRRNFNTSFCEESHLSYKNIQDAAAFLFEGILEARTF